MAQSGSEFTKGLYFAGLLILAAGLPLSMFMMSISQIVLLSGWIISGNIIQKLKEFFTNPVTLLLGAVFLMHFAGFAWSSDISYAIHDTRIKLPLLLLPLIISTSEPLSGKKFNCILYVFISAVVLATLISMAVLMGYTSHKVNDIRDISIFISHIRFGLMICIAIYCLLWFIFSTSNKLKSWQNLALLLIIFWLVSYLVISEAMTAIIVLVLVSLLYGFVFLLKNPNWLIKAFLLIPLILIAWLFIYVRNISEEVSFTVKPDFSKMDPLTVRGNPYITDVPYYDTENGNAVWIFICRSEIDSVWPIRSTFNINGKDKKDQLIFYTLIRYMASKGLRKDADGLRSLTDADVKAIEAGYSNYRFTNTSSLKYRIYQIVWEYVRYKQINKPEGHSVAQRFVFWKTGWHIFKKNFLFGVGTGDVQRAFDNQYETENSKLPKEWRLRAHNQYLTFLITFGITGFLLFIISLVYPFFTIYKKTNVLYSLFLITAILSFLTEDTLETQAGATFFAFFNTLFLFGYVSKKPDIDVNSIRKSAKLS